ncbi:MAG TPA: ABC transporter ATP-binding protein [Burkholderiales bacterium]|jgi:ABC-type branched-subunit amino acid transport system ATPase component
MVLELRNLSKSFGGLKVVDQLSFSVARGERLALIGPNGAGKTTVFNLITGVYAPDAGSVLLEGSDITALPSRLRIRRGLARTFQNIRLMPHLTVLENVMIAQYARSPGVAALLQPVGFGRANRWREEAQAALGEAGLQSHANQMAGGLPYGIQKRIELVRALAAAPRVLLLDEPAAGLNPAETEALHLALQAIAARGITLVVVEHDMQFVGRLCQRVVVLNFGVKIAECAVAEIHANRQVREAYLGTDELAA